MDLNNSSTNSGISEQKRTEIIPYHFSKHKIKDEILKITKEKQMNDDEKEEFLLAIIQQQATDLENLRKRDLKYNFEREKIKLFGKLVQSYRKKIDITNEIECKDHYFELRKIIEEIIEVEEKIKEITMILNELK
nr:hypothetical protein [Lysinibacillus timonensis]